MSKIRLKQIEDFVQPFDQRLHKILYVGFDPVNGTAFNNDLENRVKTDFGSISESLYFNDWSEILQHVINNLHYTKLVIGLKSCIDDNFILSGDFIYTNIEFNGYFFDQDEQIINLLNNNISIINSKIDFNDGTVLFFHNSIIDAKESNIFTKKVIHDINGSSGIFSLSNSNLSIRRLEVNYDNSILLRPSCTGYNKVIINFDITVATDCYFQIQNVSDNSDHTDLLLEMFSFSGDRISFTVTGFVTYKGKQFKISGFNVIQSYTLSSQFTLFGQEALGLPNLQTGGTSTHLGIKTDGNLTKL